jgi:hypothetical protein
MCERVRAGAESWWIGVCVSLTPSLTVWTALFCVQLNGRVPLYFAVKKGYSEVVQALAAGGADLTVSVRAQPHPPLSLRSWYQGRAPL